MRQRKISPSITNRDAPSLNKYLQEICKIDLIPAEEEVMLARKIREGDKAALERLVKQTSGLWFPSQSNTKTWGSVLEI